MNKIESLQKQINELQTLLDDLKGSYEEKTIYNMKKGDNLYYIAPFGIVSFTSYDPRESFALDCYEIGNLFFDREEAEFALRVLKLRQKLKKTQDSVDWNTEGLKYQIIYNNFLKTVDVEQNVNLFHPNLFGHWNSRKGCEQAIENNGEEIAYVLKKMMEVNDETAEID